MRLRIDTEVNSYQVRLIPNLKISLTHTDKTEPETGSEYWLNHNSRNNEAVSRAILLAFRQNFAKIMIKFIRSHTKCSWNTTSIITSEFRKETKPQ